MRSVLQQRKKGGKGKPLWSYWVLEGKRKGGMEKQLTYLVSLLRPEEKIQKKNKKKVIIQTGSKFPPVWLRENCSHVMLCSNQ